MKDKVSERRHRQNEMLLSVIKQNILAARKRLADRIRFYAKWKRVVRKTRKMTH